MASDEHRALLLEGVDTWNRDRPEDVDLHGADLRGADLRGAELSQSSLFDADLSDANLSGANLRKAYLTAANLRSAFLNDANLTAAYVMGADLSQARLRRVDLRRAELHHSVFVSADLRDADLRRAKLPQTRLTNARLRHADLRRARLRGADLTGAFLRGADLRSADLRDTDLTAAELRKSDLREADLTGARLIETDIDRARLTAARVYGTSVWNVTGLPKAQNDLVITSPDEGVITVDDLKVAQFIHLLIANREIRNVIDTVARKAVLILGSFAPERKPVLDGLRSALRNRNYVPILFDFDKLEGRTLTETVRTLAHLSRFIIADLTDPSSIPQELQAIVPDLAVPVAPVLSGDEAWSMFEDLQRRHHWVLAIHRYRALDDLVESLDAGVIEPAERKAEELTS